MILALDMLSQLPPVCVESMTKVQLNEFIPQLVTISTGRQCPLFGKTQFKPEWWPEEVAWACPEEVTETVVTAELMRKVVRSCYKHLGQESLLGTDSPLPATKMADQCMSNTSILNEHDNNQRSDDKDDEDDKEEIYVNISEVMEENINRMDSETKERATQDSNSNADDSQSNPIWVCFLCAKQFTHQNELMVHQDLCEQEEEMRPTPEPVVPKMVVRVYPTPSTVQRFTRRKRRFKLDPYIPPPKEDFISKLYLIEKPKSNDMTPSKKETTEIDSDCEIVDIEMMPSTPRTPKSLMSQLSRDIDNSARKRHLSFSQGAESDSESASEADHVSLPVLSSLLYNIDLTSPLGQKVKKHLKTDNFQTVKNPELFCRGADKSGFTDKLRQRENVFPIVFNKKRKKFMARHVHRFKFNKSQRKEFMMTVRTGLNKKSRKLLAELSRCPCQVSLQRLKPEVIKEWIRPKPRPHYITQRYLQASSHLYNYSNSQTQLLRRALAKPVMGPMSAKLRQMNQSLAMLSRHKPKPPPSMVTQIVKNLDGSETMRIIYNQQKPNNPPNPNTSRRKQNFDSNRLRNADDEVIIIDMSSSDEEEENKAKPIQKPGPSSARSNPNYQRPGPACSKRPKPVIGPLSVRTGQHNPQQTIVPSYTSPPGASTCKEMMLKPMPKLGGPGAQRLHFGSAGQGLVNTGIQITNVRSLQNVAQSQQSVNSHFRIQGPPGIQRPRHIAPQGDRIMNKMTNPPRMQHMPNLQRALTTQPQQIKKAYSPVKTSVEKMEINGVNDNKEVVDVICIDDDD